MCPAGAGPGRAGRSPERVEAGYGPAHRASEGFAAAIGERGLNGVDVPCGDQARSGQERIERLRSITGAAAARRRPPPPAAGPSAARGMRWTGGGLTKIGNANAPRRTPLGRDLHRG